MPTPGTVRDRAVDVARLAALVVVMFGHCALLLATIDSGGVRIGNLLGALPALAPVTWVVQVMPLFFLAGGAAGAYGWHSGTPWGTWLFTRAQRLCRPVFWYLAVWVAALVVVRLLLGPESADALGRESVALLWFLGVYLIALAFVPLLIRLRTGRAVAALVAALLAAAWAVDGFRSAVGTPESGVLNFLIVWLIPVVVGVAYARRLISPLAAVAAGVAALAAQCALVVAGTYEVALVVTGIERFSNVSPPTLLLRLHCTWMSCAFVALAAPIRRWAARPRVWRIVAAGNAGAMTIYLWHIPAIAVAAFALHAVGLDAYDVEAPDFWAMLALRAVVFAGVMAALFRLLAPLEHRPLPWWDDRGAATGARSALSGVLVCAAGAASVLMAKQGLAGGAGWAALGAFIAAAVAARLCAGSAVSDRTHWDRRYARLGSPQAGLPDLFADHADVFPTTGFALDVACGQGRIALWLAERGMTVQGYDVSAVAVADATAAARHRHVADRCRFDVFDLDDGLPAGPPADVIVCHLFRDERLDRALVERLAPGGLLAIAALSEVGATAGRFRVRPGELSDAFADLDVVAEGEGSGRAWLMGRRPPPC